jgi:hypothetical protein
MNKSPVNELEMGIVKELVSKLPVEAIYRDGVAPSIVQTGSILSDLLKTVHLALAPFQLLVSVRKVSESFESVSGYLKKGLESIESPVIRYVSPIREVADVDERGAYPA